jgi:hypothetical protein
VKNPAAILKQKAQEQEQLQVINPGNKEKRN